MIYIPSDVATNIFTPMMGSSSRLAPTSLPAGINECLDRSVWKGWHQDQCKKGGDGIPAMSNGWRRLGGRIHEEDGRGGTIHLGTVTGMGLLSRVRSRFGNGFTGGTLPIPKTGQLGILVLGQPKTTGLQNI